MLSLLGALWRSAFPANLSTGPVFSDDGRGPRNDGPPDLDKLWQDFNRNLANLFGRRKGNNGFNPPPSARPPVNLPLWIGVGVAVAVALWIFSGVFTVQEGQVGVVTEFGKYKYTTGAGIQWHLPAPIQSVEVVLLSQSRSVEVGGRNMIREANLKDSSMLTQDENIVDVRFAVQYRVKDPTDFIFKNAASADETVRQAGETAVREIVGRNTMDFVLYEGRAKIANDLMAAIQRLLDLYQTGILVTTVTMQSVQPPEQVQAAFDDAVKAGQDRERKKNEGQAYANDVVPRARGDAARLVLEAQGYQANVVAHAEGDASRFKQVLAEYAKAPAVTRDRMYLDTMQAVFSNTTTVLVDSHSSNNLLYLPLDKLIDQSRAAAAAGATGSASLTPQVTLGNPTATLDDSRARDAARSRERETR